jgi:Ca-activated chloride channel family protein
MKERGGTGLRRNIVYTIAACLVIFMFPLRGYGKTIAGLVKEGNSAYNAGEYDKAVTAYDEALKEGPESPYAYFNKGAALYRKGDYSGAAEAFEKAAMNSKDKQFEAKSRFNLGNSAYKEAEGQKDKDLQKALEGCSKSVNHYKEALRLDPSLKEAAENIEMVRLVMKDILEEMKNQKESDQKDQEKKEQAAEKLKEIIKEQENALTKNRGLAKEQEGKSGSKALDKKIGDLADEQKAIRDKTEALSKEWPEDRSQDNASGKVPASKRLENATKEQDAAYGNLGQKNTRSAAKNQDEAIKELKEALDSQQKGGNNGAGQEDKDQQDKQQGQQQQQQQQSSSDEDKKDGSDQEQAAQVNLSDDAQDILKDEKENKEQRKAIMLRGYKGVDKDW